MVKVQKVIMLSIAGEEKITGHCKDNKVSVSSFMEESALKRIGEGDI